MTYDNWKTTNPDDERLGLEPPPCERPVPRFQQHMHPRFPSGYCVVCAAEAHQGCLWDGADAWEAQQKDPDAEYERKRDDAMWDRQCGWDRDEP